MSTNSGKKKTFSGTARWLLLGVCVGAGGLIYLKKRADEVKYSTSGSDEEVSSADQMPKPGDILLFHNAKGLNKIITGFTRSPFYHAGLYAGDGNTVEARTPGVLRQRLDGRESDFVVIPAPKGKGKVALAWAETQVGDRYDDLDIIVIILDRLCRLIKFNYTPRNKYSCGEFVAVAFQKAGADLFPNRDLGEVVPGDFARFLPSADHVVRPGEIKG